jgi:hypothetical protein
MLAGGVEVGRELAPVVTALGELSSEKLFPNVDVVVLALPTQRRRRWRRQTPCSSVLGTGKTPHLRMIAMAQEERRLAIGLAPGRSEGEAIGQVRGEARSLLPLVLVGRGRDIQDASRSRISPVWTRTVWSAGWLAQAPWPRWTSCSPSRSRATSGSALAGLVSTPPSPIYV